ncbi:unnamed protein product [Leptosia nina]|uniref:Peptidase S1 domain-containing protein n=1 Tax=Leptosia nina TaxID=320188 RepID=A0AAV1J4I0_9NEOP
MRAFGVFCLYVCFYTVRGGDSENLETGEDGEHNTTKVYTDNDDTDDSEEHIGAAVTQVYKHPYAASLLKNDSYVCSAVVLNSYWLITLSKCFDTSAISSHVNHKYLSNYTIRTGSNYNNKGGNISKIKMTINNFDLKVTAVKVSEPLLFDARVQAVNLPSPDDDVSLGYLTSLLAWTPTGKDNGGAVIQNNTLIGISAFLHTCALYTKTHAFPKAASFARWLDSIIWDEDNRPTTTSTSTPTHTINTEKTTEFVDRNPYFGDPRFMLTLPFDPVNVPLEPAEDNSVIPRMSLYESYLQNMARLKTSTTLNPKIEERKKWLEKFGKIMLMKQYPKKYDFDYN